MQTLMDLCAKSEKSTGDAYRLLFNWGVNKADHDAIISRLIKDKFIDNRRYAAAFMRDKMNFSHWGSYRIRTGLREKRIEEDIINEVLAGIDDTVMNNKLLQQLTHKMKNVKYKNTYDLRGKLLRYGAGLGFGHENVTNAVEEIMKTATKEEDEDNF